ncbi:MAG: hypothetical protein AAF982_12405 [Pseudomonadota bacterium]
MKTSSISLSEADLKTLTSCVDLAANANFFDDDEFETLFGGTRDAFGELIKNQTNIDPSDENTIPQINNAVLNAFSYPQASPDAVERHPGGSYRGS